MCIDICNTDIHLHTYTYLETALADCIGVFVIVLNMLFKVEISDLSNQDLCFKIEVLFVSVYNY